MAHGAMSRLRATTTAHPELAAVLVAGVGLRVGAMVAYPKGLFFSDSWAYLTSAWRGAVPEVMPDRPNGYPVVIKLVTLGHHLTPLFVVQHLAGLTTGGIAYVFLVRRGLPRIVGAAAAALLVLNADAIALEQHVMPEALFTLTLLAVAVLTVTRPRDPRTMILCGALLAFAIMLRSAAVFVVPVWLIYLLVSGSRISAMLAASAVLLVPLVGYGLAVQHRWHHFGLTAAGGWFLYGRVAEIARCDGLALSRPEQRICRATEAAQRPGRSSGFFIWHHASPAHRAFGSPSTGVDRERRANAALGDIGRAVIRDRPVAYAQLVARDLLRYFTPGEHSLGHSDEALTLPAPPFGALTAPERKVRDELLPDYAPVGRFPVRELHAYQRFAGTPRIAAALLLAAGLGAVAAFAAGVRDRRSRLPAGGEVALLLGMALALLVGSVLTSAFIVRYLVPAVPLIVCGGLLGAGMLRGLGDRPRRAPSSS